MKFHPVGGVIPWGLADRQTDRHTGRKQFSFLKEKNNFAKAPNNEQKLYLLGATE
jgi:hypothetical protein